MLVLISGTGIAPGAPVTESRVVEAPMSTTQSTRRPPHLPCNRKPKVSGSLVVSN